MATQTTPQDDAGFKGKVGLATQGLHPKGEVHWNLVAPVLILLSYVIGPAPMNLQFWPGAIVMMLIATMTAALVTNSGRSAWFVGVLVLNVYLIFAMTLYLLSPQVH